MSDKNVVHAHAQRDFRQALECEPEGTLLVLNERGFYVIPVAHRDAPFPEVVVRDEATLMGGNSVKAPWADVVEEIEFDWRQVP